MKFIRFSAVGALLLASAACNTTKIESGIAQADLKLRDKCAYLISGVQIAQIASAFIPNAAPIVAQGSALIDAYCGAKPITDLPSAMAAMERVIVSVRPLADQIK